MRSKLRELQLKCSFGPSVGLHLFDGFLREHLVLLVKFRERRLVARKITNLVHTQITSLSHSLRVIQAGCAGWPGSVKA
jgi:hypothetical protein